MWSTLSCMYFPCSLSEAEEGAKTEGQAQVTTRDLSSSA